MPPTIHFGTNLGFARYVWGPQKALEIVKDRLGLYVAEPVTENDFGSALWLTDSAAFQHRHAAIGQFARERGIRIPTVFTYYRDSGAIAHPDPAVQRAARCVLGTLIEQARALGTEYACASLMTPDREEFEAHPHECQERAAQAWFAVMESARAAGLTGLLLEMSAQLREDCATLQQTHNMLTTLRLRHQAFPDTTVPVELCYDLGHGISPAEDPDDRQRDFRAWFQEFSHEIREIHLKNTDPNFLATWPFTPEYKGIIEPAAVVEAVRDLLHGEVYLMLEIAGKRGRTLGENAILEDLAASARVWEAAFQSSGYHQTSPGTWTLEPLRSDATIVDV